MTMIAQVLNRHFMLQREVMRLALSGGFKMSGKYCI
jgi:hypothetical protein